MGGKTADGDGPAGDGAVRQGRGVGSRGHREEEGHQAEIPVADRPQAAPGMHLTGRNVKARVGSGRSHCQCMATGINVG